MLLANGASGSWEIAIDETASGAGRWWAQIEGPTATFYFEIPGVDIVGKMIEFLEHAQASLQRACSLVISKPKENRVALVKDEEYADRFFLTLGSSEKPLARFVLTGPDVSQIAAALRQVQEDFDEE
ncbi:MAG TPA: hypothetical protein VMV10_03695 [Pirellulales bacterium]|nr:hypothetical protein [Pirellulales bacterium]